MTSSATLRWRPPRRVLALSVAENVVAIHAILAAGRPAVVAHRKRLLAGQRGCCGMPAYAAGSSLRSLPRADVPARKTRRFAECTRIAVGEGPTRSDLQRAGRQVPRRYRRVAARRRATA